MSAAPPAPAPTSASPASSRPARAAASCAARRRARGSPRRKAPVRPAARGDATTRRPHANSAVVFDDAGAAGVRHRASGVTSASSASSRRSTSGCSCRKNCAWLPAFWPTRTLTRPAIGCAKASSSVRSSPTYSAAATAQDRQVARERGPLVVLSGGREVEVGVAPAQDAHLRQRLGEARQRLLGARQIRHVTIVHRQRPALVLDLEPRHVPETARERIVPAPHQVLDLGGCAPRLQAVIARDACQRNPLESRRQIAHRPS